VAVDVLTHYEGFGSVISLDIQAGDWHPNPLVERQLAGRGIVGAACRVDRREIDEVSRITVTRPSFSLFAPASHTSRSACGRARLAQTKPAARGRAIF
jgi:hypothetical protein